MIISFFLCQASSFARQLTQLSFGYFLVQVTILVFAVLSLFLRKKSIFSLFKQNQIFHHKKMDSHKLGFRSTLPQRFLWRQKKFKKHIFYFSLWADFYFSLLTLNHASQMISSIVYCLFIEHSRCLFRTLEGCCYMLFCYKIRVRNSLQMSCLFLLLGKSLHLCI